MATSTASSSAAIFDPETQQYCVDNLQVSIDATAEYYLQVLVAGVASNAILVEANTPSTCRYKLGSMNLCDLSSILSFCMCVLLLWVTVARHSILVTGPVQLVILVFMWGITISSSWGSTGTTRDQAIVQLVLLGIITLISLGITIRGFLLYPSERKDQPAHQDRSSQQSDSDGGSGTGSGSGAAKDDMSLQDEASPLVPDQTVTWYSEFVTEKKFVYRQYVAAKLRGAYR